MREQKLWERAQLRDHLFVTVPEFLLVPIDHDVGVVTAEINRDDVGAALEDLPLLRPWLHIFGAAASCAGLELKPPK